MRPRQPLFWQVLFSQRNCVGIASNKLSDYTVMTTGGQRAQTVLPDGSKVLAECIYEAYYRNSFWSTDRQIDLSGEAYFEVARDKHAPFIVNTKHIKTCVLGTKFNVRAREEEDRVVTTLCKVLYEWNLHEPSIMAIC
ncbi:FecR family protein [Bacteroides thetaiotaomicron]|uniref:FecR family protein n=1 Tax=Bacteroides thetaiotaomicron TaxID=818 RepID=UPI001F5B1E3B